MKAFGLGLLLLICAMVTPTLYGAETTYSYYMPHLINEDGKWASRIYIINSGVDPVDVVTTIYKSTGEVLATSESKQLPPGARDYVKLSSYNVPFNSENAAWALVTAKGPLVVEGLLHSTSQDAQDDLLSVAGLAKTARMLKCPYIATKSPFNTYISIVNPENKKTEIVVKSYTESGLFIEQLSFELAGNASIERNLAKSMSRINEASLITVESSMTNITGVVIYENTVRHVESSVPMNISSDLKNCVLPFMVDMSGWKSFAIITNTGAVKTDVTLRVYTNSGKPAKDAVKYEIGPRSRKIVETSSFMPADKEAYFSFRFFSSTTDVVVTAVYESVTPATLGDFVVAPEVTAANVELFCATALTVDKYETFFAVTNLSEEETALTFKELSTSGAEEKTGGSLLKPRGTIFISASKAIKGYSGDAPIRILSTNQNGGGKIAGQFLYLNRTEGRYTIAGSTLKRGEIAKSTGDTTASIVGVVRDFASNQPLKGVRVSAGNILTQTDAEGNYKLEGVAIGSQTVRAQLVGFKEYVREMNLTPATIRLDIKMRTGASTTTFSGAITGVESWTASMSPVRVSGDIIIEPSGQLTIEDNVVVEFVRGSSMLVRGALVAKKAKLTSAEANPKPGDWRGLVFDKTIGANLNGTEIDFAGPGVTIRDCDIVMNSCLIQYNEAEFGGGVYMERSSSTLNNNVFAFNTAMKYGGGMYLMESHPKINGGVFQKNIGGDNGGGLYLHPACTAEINNVAFLDNNTRGAGGAIYIHRNCIVKINGGKFEKNSASDRGGAIDVTSAELRVSEAVFEDNKSDIGGAICIIGSKHRSSISDSVFKFNEANTGGALYADNTTVIVHHNQFDSNFARGNGGAVYMDYPDDVTLDNNVFNYNRSKGYGGGVAIYHPPVSGFYVQYNHYYSNSASFGLYFSIFIDNGGYVTYAYPVDYYAVDVIYVYEPTPVVVYYETYPTFYYVYYEEYYIEPEVIVIEDSPPPVIITDVPSPYPDEVIIEEPGAEPPVYEEVPGPYEGEPVPMPDDGAAPPDGGTAPPDGGTAPPDDYSPQPTPEPAPPDYSPAPDPYDYDSDYPDDGYTTPDGGNTSPPDSEPAPAPDDYQGGYDNPDDYNPNDYNPDDYNTYDYYDDSYYDDDYYTDNYDYFGDSGYDTYDDSYDDFEADYSRAR